ncbi:MAG: glycosyltransferase family 39 protein [Legionellales bacterium]|nr:glycosyltransferase family 39 protein [Legionellales bacterium]
MLKKIYCYPLAFFALCVIFFSLLAARPLDNPDEGRYSNIPLHMALYNQYVTPRVNGLPFLDKPPFFFWVEAIAIKLLGSKIWVFRFVPALFALLGCLLTYWFASTIFDRETGFLSGLMLATNPLYIGGAYYVNVDMTVAVLIAASLMCFLVGIGAENKNLPSAKPLLLYSAYALAALATLTKGLIGIVFPMLIIGTWILFTRRWAILKQMRLVTGLLLYSIITIPWFVLVTLENPGFLHYFFIYEQFDRFSQSGFNNQMPWFFYVMALLIGLFPWSVLFYPTLRMQIRDYKKHAYLIIWFLATLIFFSIPKSKIISYILPAVFPFVILLACFARQSWQKHPQKLYWSYYLIPAILLILSIAGYMIGLVDPSPKLVLYKDLLFYASLFLLGLSLLSYGSYRLLTPFSAIIVTAMGSALLTLGGIALAPRFTHDSNFVLAEKIKTQVAKQDDLFLYKNYLFDLPVYLQRNLIIINNWNEISATEDSWQGHFKQAYHLPEGKALLITPSQFWLRWKNTKIAYLLIDWNDYQLNKNRLHNDEIILNDQGWVLVKNKRSESDTL